MDGYEDYTYIIHDELDGGLTFDGVESMTVTVGDEDYKDTLQSDLLHRWHQLQRRPTLPTLVRSCTSRSN